MIVQCLLNLKMISILPHIHTKLTAPLVYKLYKHITKNTATRGSKKNCGCFPKVSQSHKEIKVFKNNATPIMTRFVKKKRGGEKKDGVFSSISCVTATQPEASKHLPVCRTK